MEQGAKGKEQMMMRKNMQSDPPALKLWGQASRTKSKQSDRSDSSDLSGQLKQTIFISGKLFLFLGGGFRSPNQCARSRNPGQRLRRSSPSLDPIIRSHRVCRYPGIKRFVSREPTPRASQKPTKNMLRAPCAMLFALYASRLTPNASRLTSNVFLSCGRRSAVDNF